MLIESSSSIIILLQYANYQSIFLYSYKVFRSTLQISTSNQLPATKSTVDHWIFKQPHDLRTILDLKNKIDIVFITCIPLIVHLLKIVKLNQF